MFMLFISLKKIYMPSKNEQKLLTSAFEKFIMFLMPEYIRVTFMKKHFCFHHPFQLVKLRLNFPCQPKKLNLVSIHSHFNLWISSSESLVSESGASLGFSQDMCKFFSKLVFFLLLQRKVYNLYLPPLFSISFSGVFIDFMEIFSQDRFLAPVAWSWRVQMHPLNPF